MEGYAAGTSSCQKGVCVGTGGVSGSHIFLGNFGCKSGMALKKIQTTCGKRNFQKSAPNFLQSEAFRDHFRVIKSQMLFF